MQLLPDAHADLRQDVVLRPRRSGTGGGCRRARLRTNRSTSRANPCRDRIAPVKRQRAEAGRPRGGQRSPPLIAGDSQQRRASARPGARTTGGSRRRHPPTALQAGDGDARAPRRRSLSARSSRARIARIGSCAARAAASDSGRRRSTASRSPTARWTNAAAAQATARDRGDRRPRTPRPWLRAPATSRAATSPSPTSPARGRQQADRHAAARQHRLRGSRQHRSGFGVAAAPEQAPAERQRRRWRERVADRRCGGQRRAPLPITLSASSSRARSIHA